MKSMSDKVSGDGGGTVRSYDRGDTKSHNKKYPHDNTGSSASATEHSGGHINRYLEKMFPGISEQDAKKFMSNLYNQFNNEIKREIQKSKERLKRLKEEDNE
jgi:hypothetical protein